MGRPARFNKKAFVSFLTLFYAIVIILTGIVLYFAPPGRVAHWVEWKFLGMTKEDWQAVHTIFSFIFVVIAGFHLYYNWVVFWSYLKSKVVAGIKMKQELVWASILTVGVFVLTLGEVPPFSSVMDLGEYLSNSWSNEQTEPPIPHAELFTLKEYCQETKMDLQRVMQKLQREGIQGVDSLITIGELAEKNGLTPAELAQKISEKPASAAGAAGGYGFGRMTVAQICEREGIPLEQARERLSNAHIEFQEDETLRTIANRTDLKPWDLAKIIKGESLNGD